MKITIHPSCLKGVIQAPASKSSMQRGCAAALLFKGTTNIKNFGNSNDEKTALSIIELLGANINVNGNELIINSNGISANATEINCGESGLSMRMFASLIALSKNEIKITGEGSLVNRPMHFFDTILPQLGVKVKSNNGKLPIIIQGPLLPKNIEMDGSSSSQFLTGLLMAFSAADAKNVSIKVKELKSIPYIDLTLDVMEKFGMKIPVNNNYESFYFSSETVKPQASSCNYFVEGDWSSVAFLLVAGAIAGPIIIKGLDINSKQADKAILTAMAKANAEIVIEDERIKIDVSELKAFEFDANDCPDLFPPLVALAAYCMGETKIKGLARLKHKESNRGLTLQQEFGKMGVAISFCEDEMIIQGSKEVKGAFVHSQYDHRIAMACAVAALKATGKTEIEEADAVNKSYPDFFQHLEKLGANVSLNKS